MKYKPIKHFIILTLTGDHTTLRNDTLDGPGAIRLAPDKEGNSKEAGEMALLGSATLSQLHANAESLFDQLAILSSYVVKYVYL